MYMFLHLSSWVYFLPASSFLRWESLPESAVSIVREEANVHAKLFQDEPVGSLEVRRPAHVAALRVVLVRLLGWLRRAGESGSATSATRPKWQQAPATQHATLLNPYSKTYRFCGLVPTESCGKTARFPARAEALRRRRSVSSSSNE